MELMSEVEIPNKTVLLYPNIFGKSMYSCLLFPPHG